MALLETLSKAESLLKEEKELKTAVKKDAAALHIKTKEPIEKLSDEQVLTLLQIKWIDPLITGIYAMPNIIIDDLVSKIQALSDKYATVKR